MNKIAELRKKHKLSQADLAKFVGVTQGTISKYELAQVEIPQSSISKLCTAFDVTADYLLGFSDENIKAPPQIRGEADMDFGSSSADLTVFRQIQTANSLFLNLSEAGKAQALAYLQFLSEQQAKEASAQD